MPVPDSRRIAVAIFVAIVASFGLFAARPGLDGAVAGWFYYTTAKGGHFLAERIGWVEVLRDTLWGATLLGFLWAVAALVVGVAQRRQTIWGYPLRLWAYLAAVYVAGPALLVNGVLKAHWGRARPYQLGDFGGEALFTPFWKITDQCQRNCSFVSGEVAGTTALAVLILVLAWQHRPALSGPKRGAMAALAAALPVLVALQRMAVGRHFLSDCVLALLFTAFLAAVLYRPIVGPGGAGGGGPAAP